MATRQSKPDPSHFKTFGDLLRHLRERARLSQRDLAQRVGYHYSYLSRLEKNVRAPDELILRTRFIPALRIEHDHAWTDRLFELAMVEQNAATQSTAASTPDPARAARRLMTDTLAMLDHRIEHDPENHHEQNRDDDHEMVMNFQRVAGDRRHRFGKVPAVIGTCQ